MIPNSYKVIKELGRGAAGVVSLVRRRSDGRLFAAKQILFTAVGDGSAASVQAERHRVLKEVRMLQQLPHHPSVVALEEIFDGRDGVVLVMEYVDGGSLFEVVYPSGGVGGFGADTEDPHRASAYSPREGEGGGDWSASTWGDAPSAPHAGMASRLGGGAASVEPPLPEERVLQWLFQLGNAVAFLHSNGVMHRDLKLSNILLTSNSQIIKIADFGVAETTVANNREYFSTTTVGTPQYFSPEMCEGKPYNAKADVWAVGVIAYELCCRRAPFNAANILAMADAIVSDAPGRIDPFYSDALDCLVQTLMTKDPARRPSAEGLVQRVKMIRRGATVKELQALDMAAVATPAPGAMGKGDAIDADAARRQAHLEARAAAERNRQNAKAVEGLIGDKPPPRRSPSPPPPSANVAPSAAAEDPSHVDPVAVGAATAPPPQQQRQASPPPQSVVTAVDFTELREMAARNRAKLDLAFPDTPRDQQHQQQQMVESPQPPPPAAAAAVATPPPPPPPVATHADHAQSPAPSHAIVASKVQLRAESTQATPQTADRGTHCDASPKHDAEVQTASPSSVAPPVVPLPPREVLRTTDAGVQTDPPPPPPADSGCCLVM